MKPLPTLGVSAVLAATLVSTAPAQAVLVNMTATATCTDTCTVVPTVQPLLEGVGINRPVSVNYGFLSMAHISLKEINQQPGEISIDLTLANTNPSPTITYSIGLGLFDDAGEIFFQTPIIDGFIPGDMQLTGLSVPLSIDDRGVEFFGIQLAFSVSTQTSAELTLFGIDEIRFSRFDTNPLDVPEPTTLALFAVGLGALGFVGWRRRHSSQAA